MSTLRLHALLLVLLGPVLGNQDPAWSVPSVAQLVPMPQVVTSLQQDAELVTITGGLLACLSRVAFSGEGDHERLVRALQREIGQRDAGGSVFVMDGALAEQACAVEASGRLMTPLYVYEVERIEGLDAGTDLAGGVHTSSSEAYSLEVGRRRIAISAVGMAGAFRAVQTLMQMCFLNELDRNREDLPQGERGAGQECRIAAVRVVDWPDLENRGVMLDISRNRIPTVETARLLIDTLSALKINQVQMYTEHTFAYSSHSTVWAQSGAITAAEAQDLSAYAHARFVTLVPNQQSFGHMQHWLKHKQYANLAESKAGSRKLWNFDYCCPLFSDEELMPYSLAPNNASLALLTSLYDELLTAFPHSRAVNIGMDETFDLGDGASREQVRRVGKHTVYANFLNNISAALAERDPPAHAMFWGDIIFEHPHLFLGKLAKDSRVLDWGYEAHAPFASRGRALKHHGIKSYVCPGTSSWLSFGGRVTNAVRNVINAAQSGAWFGAEGMLITDWGDGGHLQVTRGGLPRARAKHLSNTAQGSQTPCGV